MDWTTLALAVLATVVAPLVGVAVAWLRSVLGVVEYDHAGQSESDQAGDA